MKKSRLGYAALLLSMVVLLVVFSKPFLLVMLLVLTGLVVLTAGLVRIDAERLQVEFHVRTGEQAGRETPLTFLVHTRGRLLAVRSVLVELEIHNAMFHTTECRQFLLRITGKEDVFQTMLRLEQCGETDFRCVRIQAQDLMNLFSRPCRGCPSVRTVVYPPRVSVQVSLSRELTGEPRADGLMQNRRGNDPSEMFEIREYLPGDDVRSIHWKLSAKMDKLFLRQASAPAHDYIALLPDLGLTRNGQSVSRTERNGAVALGVAIGEQLVQQGMMFCMVIPAEDGLHCCEVHSPREFQTALTHWLGYPVRQEGGAGLKYLCAEHLEQSFTRLVILSAGRYEGELSELDSQIGVTVVSAVDSQAAVYAQLNENREVVEVPAVPSGDEVFRILC